jgi:pimeloyl-ACP methyl ester carboxylesterase
MPAAAGAQRSATRVADDGWRDTTHHRPGFVRVERDVRIHYLDFGGDGPPLVFLAGLGNTAHAFDDFAPAFTDRFHVIALTRRGFGESDHPATGYDTPRLVADIAAVLDSLHLPRVSFVGHSIAGEEMTRFAATYPRRVDKLVYLDAAYDRVRANELFDAAPIVPGLPAPPSPRAEDTASAGAYVAFVHRTRGVGIPDADIRTRFRFDDWNEEITPAYLAITVEPPAYRAIRAPALAIYAVTDSVAQLEPWQRDDAEHAAAWRASVRVDELVYRQLRAEFARDVRRASVLEIHGAHHWIFVSDRTQVLRAARQFLLAP